MSKKTNFELDRALRRIANPSVFDRIVKEIDAKEIPTDYIESITVYYQNGRVVELRGAEITHPVPVNRDGSWEDMNQSFKNMKEVKVFINTEKLEYDVNLMVEDYLIDIV